MICNLVLIGAFLDNWPTVAFCRETALKVNQYPKNICDGNIFWEKVTEIGAPLQILREVFLTFREALYWKTF